MRIKTNTKNTKNKDEVPRSILANNLNANYLNTSIWRIILAMWIKVLKMVNLYSADKHALEFEDQNLEIKDD